MKYKKLGSTNLEVSVVGFGGIPIQKTNVSEVKNILDKAEKLGMNFIDTARGYTVSEEYIGEALEGVRHKWIIATKSMARDRETMLKDVEISLNNLRTDYIDLYQLHNVKAMDEYEKATGDDGAYKALEQLKAEGKIGHIGITAHSLDVLKVAIESKLFETIMYPYNIVEDQGLELFKRAKELNIGIIIMKPMAGGALTNGTLALKYILKNDDITTAIPGMATEEEIEENCSVANKEIIISKEEEKEIQSIKKELGTEFCRRCGYCQPCTKGINIPVVFLMKGYKDRYGLSKWAEERYEAMDNKAGDCIECGVCEKRCPYDLPIIKMLKEVKKTFGK